MKRFMLVTLIVVGAAANAGGQTNPLPVPPPAPPAPLPQPLIPLPTPAAEMRVEMMEMASSSRAVAMRLLKTALPTVAGDFYSPPGASATGQGWTGFLSSSARPSPQNISAVAHLLREPIGLLPVPELFNELVGDRVAVATCDAHNPVIYYSSEALARFDARVVQFVRQHELAHHRLNQVNCSGPKPVFAGYNEKEADCRALSVLRASGARGRDIAMSTSTMFYLLNHPAEDPYPASHERAKYLEQGCGTPWPDSQ